MYPTVYPSSRGVHYLAGGLHYSIRPAVPTEVDFHFLNNRKFCDTRKAAVSLQEVVGEGFPYRIFEIFVSKPSKSLLIW